MSTDRPRELKIQSDLDLRRLAPLAPPRDVLPGILAEVHRRDGAQRRQARWPRWTAAAVLLVALGIISLLTQRVDRQRQELTQWVQYSQELEAQLRVVGGRNQVVRGHRAAALGELESQLALIDWQLSQRPQAGSEINLWRQRVLLLNDLVTVRADERVSNDDQARRPVITINNPSLPAIPASHEI